MTTKDELAALRDQMAITREHAGQVVVADATTVVVAAFAPLPDEPPHRWGDPFEIRLSVDAVDKERDAHERSPLIHVVAPKPD